MFTRCWSPVRHGYVHDPSSPIDQFLSNESLFSGLMIALVLSPGIRLIPSAQVSRMEHQQHQHLQQLVNLDSLENSNARALVLKLINVLLTILQVILLLVATVANIITPFLHTRSVFLNS